MSFQDEQYFIDKPNGLTPSTPLPEQGGFNEKLDEILDLYTTLSNREQSAFKQAIRDLISEGVIGEDAPADLPKRVGKDANGKYIYETIEYSLVARTVNKTKAEQRKIIGSEK